MALLHVYKSVSDYETRNVSGGAVYEHCDTDNSVILVNGRRVTPDYGIKDDDIIFVRKIPQAAITSLGVVGTVVVGTAAVISAIGIGGIVYTGAECLMNYIEEQVNAAATETSNRITENSKVQNLPFIKGASNRPATGNCVPYIIGETIFSPYRLENVSYSIQGDKGEKQYFNIILTTGYGQQSLKEIRIGNTRIKSFSQRTVQDDIFQFDSGIYYDADSIIEVRQNGTPFQKDVFKHKTKLQELSAVIPDDGDEQAVGIVQELPDRAKQVDVFIMFNGLRAINSEGYASKRKVEIVPQWTDKADPQESDWHDFTHGFMQGSTYSNSFEYNTSKEMRFKATQTFSTAGSYKVRVKRTTPRKTSAGLDTCYVVGVQSIIGTPDPVISSALESKLVRIGIKITANSNTARNLGAISVITSGVARKYSSTSTPKWGNCSVTSNPASWILELLTTGIHSPSQYTDSEIDLDSLGTLYEYCESMGFKADGAVTKGTKKSDIISKLLTLCNSALVYNPMTGKIETVIDKGSEYPVAMLNEENIIDITMNKELKRKPDGKKIKFINKDADYAQDSVIVMADGGAYDPSNDTLTESSVDYVVNYEHACKMAWRAMAVEKTRPRTLTVRVSREGAYYPLFSRVDVEHRILHKNITHTVIKEVYAPAGKVSALTVDAPLAPSVEGITSERLGLIVNAVTETGRKIIHYIARINYSQDNRYLIIMSSDSDFVPDVGNVASVGELIYGEFDYATEPMLIAGIEDAGDSFELTLVDYNADVYEYGDMPEYKSNITEIPDETSAPKDLFLFGEDKPAVSEEQAEIIANTAANAALETMERGESINKWYKINPPTASLEDIIRRMDEDAVKSNASIQMSEEQILLQVESLETNLRAALSITAGSIDAMVSGGGASGALSLSVGLPAMINADTRASFVSYVSESAVSAVYQQSGDYYTIKPTATETQIKALYLPMIRAGRLASNVEINADNVVIRDGESTETIIQGGKIVNNLIDTKQLIAELAVIENITITGNSLFQGEIKSGPLELLNTTAKSSTVTLNGNLYGVIDNYNSFSYTGTYKDVTFNKAVTRYVHNKVIFGAYETITILELYMDGTKVKAEEQTRAQAQNYPEPYFEGTAVINYTMQNSKTFKLKDLPSAPSSETGVVYKDSNGFLRIS